MAAATIGLNEMKREDLATKCGCGTLNRIIPRAIQTKGLIAAASATTAVSITISSPVKTLGQVAHGVIPS